MNAQNIKINPYKTRKFKKTSTRYVSNNSNSIRANINSRNVFVTAVCEDNTWCDPIDIDLLMIETKEKDSGANVDARKRFIKDNNDPRFKYRSLKYRINNYTLNDLSKIAYESIAPIPLMDYTYSSEKGLFLNDKK